MENVYLPVCCAGVSCCCPSAVSAGAAEKKEKCPFIKEIKKYVTLSCHVIQYNII